LDFDAMREALDGVNRAYFVYPIRPGLVQATAQFAQSALKAGVDGIVNMSQISARATPRAIRPASTGWRNGFSIGRGSGVDERKGHRHGNARPAGSRLVTFPESTARTRRLCLSA
jgi:hypothetical protein